MTMLPEQYFSIAISIAIPQSKDLGLSPSHLLFHRQLCNYTPSHPEHQLHKEWLLQQNIVEKNPSAKYSQVIKDYNSKSHVLQDLLVVTKVVLQNTKDRRWNPTTAIVELLPHNNVYKCVVQNAYISKTNAF